MESILFRKQTRFVFTSEANCVTEQLYRLWSLHSESVDHRSGVTGIGRRTGPPRDICFPIYCPLEAGQQHVRAGWIDIDGHHPAEGSKK